MQTLLDKQAAALDAASSFGKGKMITESEKMIMAKNKPVERLKQLKETVSEPAKGSFLVKKYETVKVPAKKSVKVMKKMM